jgi:hypothetical protein
MLYCFHGSKVCRRTSHRKDARLIRLHTIWHAAALAVTVANRDHRIVVDKPKPDPKGACQQ